MFFGYLFPFFLGLVFGSFMNVIVWRIPRGLNFVTGRSVCPKCKKQISWYDNIPLLSFILLGGKCRSCHKKISIRYPIIESATAAGFIFIYYFATTFRGFAVNGPLGYWEIPFLFTIFLILESIFIIDLEHQYIPDEIIFFGITVTFLFFLIFDYQRIFINLFSGFLASVFLLCLHLITRGKGMGLGDVKFAVLGGLLVGFPYLFTWLFLSFLTGGFVGMIMILAGKAKLGQKIPFGPFLAFALIVTILFGNYLTSFV